MSNTEKNLKHWSNELVYAILAIDDTKNKLKLEIRKKDKCKELYDKWKDMVLEEQKERFEDLEQRKDKI